MAAGTGQDSHSRDSGDTTTDGRNLLRRVYSGTSDARDNSFHPAGFTGNNDNHRSHDSRCTGFPATGSQHSGSFAAGGERYGLPSRGGAHSRHSHDNPESNHAAAVTRHPDTDNDGHPAPSHDHATHNHPDTESDVT
jgi:hypothetical protein